MTENYKLGEATKYLDVYPNYANIRSKSKIWLRKKKMRVNYDG